MAQNVDLISEINDLKREKKNLRDELRRKSLNIDESDEGEANENVFLN